MLWGLGVGYVISGMYFGWNLGLEKGGTLGMGIATFFIIILYVTFIFSYAELASAIPQAGGGFDYARRAFGDTFGFIAGMAQNIAFIFAPPAIAFAIGAYFHLFFPSIPILGIATGSYLIFTALNIRGIKISALFELGITLFAVGELLLFAGITLPHFSADAFFENPLPRGISGIFAAIPFAIWFFLGLEGVANVAEETINPQRTMKLGFSSALITLVILCLLVFTGAVGVGGWASIVYQEDGATSDSPLPMALIRIVGTNHFLYHLLVTIGLFGLIASFHGLILAAGRASYEFGKVRFAPPLFGKIHPRFHTPANALLLNMCLGLIALFTGKTGQIITIAVFGSLFLYVFSMLAMIRLRKTEPDLPRPFKVPFYPLFPYTALALATTALIAMIVFNFYLFLFFAMIIAICLLIFTRYKPTIS
jgi:ethanolamine permease